MRWLAKASEAFADAPDPLADESWWVQRITSVTWRTSIAKIPRQQGEATTAAEAEHDGEWVCQTCDKRFFTQQAWASHRNRAHGEQDRILRWVAQPFCLACLRYYHTMDRAARHMKTSTRCSLLVSSCVEPFSEEELATARAEDRKRRDSEKAVVFGVQQLPWIQMQGPLCSCAASDPQDQEGGLALQGEIVAVPQVGQAMALQGELRP